MVRKDHLRWLGGALLLALLVSLPSCGDGAPPPSLILISIDTLRADRLSLYGYERPTTPNLDRWAEQATVFENVVAPASWTAPSHLSLFTGLEAWRHGFNHDVGSLARSLAAKVEMPLLAERLSAAGFVTAAETGGAYLDPAYGFDRGFDTYAAWPRPERIDEELSTLVDRALDFDALHRHEPYFFFLHTYEVHDPYSCHSERWSELTELPEPPRGTRIALKSEAPSIENGLLKQNAFQLRPPTSKTPLDHALIQACYDAGVARMDKEIGRLLEGLAARDGRLPLVVLTSDHGESLGEHGRIGHNRLEDSNLLVPLIIADPSGRGAGLRIERQVRLIDLLPSLLELLGLAPAEGIDGRSLVPFLDGEDAEIPTIAWSYSATGNRGISMRQSNRLKAIIANSAWPSIQGPTRLFDLRADPDEAAEMQDPELAQRLESLSEGTFSAQAVGLRMRLQSGGEPFSGWIRGPSVTPQGIKSIDLDCPGTRRRRCAECPGTRPCMQLVAPGEARFEIPAGTTITLHFERIVDRSLEIVSDAGSLSLQFDQILEKESFKLEESGWIEADGELITGETGLLTYWHGIGPVEGQAIEYDPELRRQLESLGYL